MPHSPTPIRVLVIGAGPMADIAHLPALARLRDLGQVILAIVCDIDSQRALAACRKFGFLESTGDALAALQRPDIDVVYVLATAQLHFEYGMAALQSGKHLFVEKPIAPSYRQAVSLAQIASERSLIAVGGLNRRFLKSLQVVRQRAGAAGWRYAEAVFHKAEFRHPPPFGALTFLSANGIHALDALIYMMNGIPQELSSFAGENDQPYKSIFSAVMRWQSGAQGVFLCNNNAGSRREEYVFHAAGETCSVDDSGLSLQKNGIKEHMPFSAIGDGVLAEHETFLDAVRSGVSPLHSIAAIAPSMFVAELIEEGFSGRVEIPPTPVAATAIREMPQKTIIVAPSAELQAPLSLLASLYRFAVIEDIRKSPDQRPDVVAAILGRGSAPLLPEDFNKLPRLQVVGIMGLSVARHDADILLQRNICVINAGDSYADSVAEFALGLAILARRRAFDSHAVMRAGGWGADRAALGLQGLTRRLAQRARPAVRLIGLEPMLLTAWRKILQERVGVSGNATSTPRDLRGAVVGLLGWGHNARRFASHLREVGAHVVVYTEHAQEDEIRRADASPASLSEALAADIVSLHRGLTPLTRHFLGAAELARLRPGSVLINTARGALICPNALLARLQKGDIFACLDTYEDEPLASADALRALPNVFLTSHIAGGSRDMHLSAAHEVVGKVAAFLSGAAVAAVSETRLKTMS